MAVVARVDPVFAFMVSKGGALCPAPWGAQNGLLPLGGAACSRPYLRPKLAMIAHLMWSNVTPGVEAGK